jgi:hypothetical protein
MDTAQSTHKPAQSKYQFNSPGRLQPRHAWTPPRQHPVHVPGDDKLDPDVAKLSRISPYRFRIRIIRNHHDSSPVNKPKWPQHPGCSPLMLTVISVHAKKYKSTSSTLCKS